MPTPTNNMRCHGGVYQSPLLKVTGSGLYGTTLIKGGPAAELSVTWQNNSGVDLPVVHNSLYVTDEFDGDYPVQWSTEFFDVQLNTGSGWKPAKLDDRDLQSPDIKLAKGEKITYQVRIAATAKAPVGNYGANYDAGSDAFDNDKVPTPANDKPNACTQFYNPFEGKFRVAEAGGASSTPRPPATVRPPPRRRRARTWPRPAPTPTPCRSPSAAPPSWRPAPAPCSSCAAARPARTADPCTRVNAGGADRGPRPRRSSYQFVVSVRRHRFAVSGRCPQQGAVLPLEDLVEAHDGAPERVVAELDVVGEGVDEEEAPAGFGGEVREGVEVHGAQRGRRGRAGRTWVS